MVCEASDSMCVVQCDSVHKVKMRMVQCELVCVGDSAVECRVDSSRQA